MVPYALKVVWFALSLAGLLSSWFALPACTKVIVRGAWIPVVYGAANTLLQGIFVLGLIWKMDPLQMPQGFCTAQTAVMHVCWSLLAGLCAATTLKAASDMYSGTLLGSLLRRISGRLSQVTLVVFFPLVIMAIQLGLVFRLSAVQSVDGLNCDASNPTWVRLLGYAGTSLLLAVPSLVLSVAMSVRLSCHAPQRQAATSTSHTVYSHDALTSLPIRPSRTRGSKVSLRHTDSLQYSIPETPHPVHSALRLSKTLLAPSPQSPSSPGRVPSQINHSKFHLPFARQPGSAPSSRRPSFGTARGSPASDLFHSRQSSNRGAPSPIIFSSPSRAESRPTIVNISPSPHQMIPDDENENDDGSITEVHHNPYGGFAISANDGVTGSFHLARGLDNDITKGKDEFGYAVAEDDLDEEPSQYAFPSHPRIRKSPSVPPWLDEDIDPTPPPTRLIAFQIYLSAILIIASITSLVDILSRRATPSPFGTQHVALILVAWAPCLFVAVYTLHRWMPCFSRSQRTLAFRRG